MSSATAPSRLGEVELDRAARTVSVAGEPVELTSREFDLLAALLAHPGVVLSRDRLLELAWGGEFAGGTRTVDVHVAQLRAKLGRPGFIETVRGAGYKVVALMRSLRGRASSSRSSAPCWSPSAPRWRWALC